MSLLDQLRAGAPANSWGRYGYPRNPFPPKGQVSPVIYDPRPELTSVEASLAKFLRGEAQGRTWALAGEAGVGKSNFLRNIDRQVDDAVTDGLIVGVAHRYLTGQQMSPRGLAEAVARAIGEERFAALFAKLREGATSVSEEIKGTSLAEFIEAVVSNPTIDVNEAAAFAIRWLSGKQTNAADRKPFEIRSRDRIPPAEALPWLRHFVDLMATFDIVSRVVLLFDEFEDVQALATSAQSEYITTLKGMVNAFNLERLFLIIAGQHTAFARMAQRLPSLSSRWELVELSTLRKPDEAIRLAQAYMDGARREWRAASKPTAERFEDRPTRLEIKAIFGDLLSAEPTIGVVQRVFLDALHSLMSELVEQ